MRNQKVIGCPSLLTGPVLLPPPPNPQSHLLFVKSVLTHPPPPFFQVRKCQCCGSGSGIRCLFDPWIRDPISGIRNMFFLDPRSRISDPGSRIPDPKPIFLRAKCQFFGWKVLYYFENWAKFFSSAFQNKKIFNFVKFMATKKVCSSLSFVAVFRSGIRDG